MYNYCITFRIADRTVNGQSYDQRRQKLIDNVRRKDFGYWEETTSFFLVESNLDTNALAKQACSGLSAEHDMVVVFDPSDMSACYFGAVKYLDVLQGFFPKLKKAP